MSDLINGRELLKSLQVYLCFGIACKDCTMRTEDGGCRVEEWIDKFPSVDIPQSDDWEKYSDRLWELAYERGKASVRPQGKWIPCTKRGLPLTELGRRERQEWYGYKCSKCNFIYKGNALTESPFCQNCGAQMKGESDV